MLVFLTVYQISINSNADWGLAEILRGFLPPVLPGSAILLTRGTFLSVTLAAKQFQKKSENWFHCWVEKVVSHSHENLCVFFKQVNSSVESGGPTG